jgi:ssDNA-specific exonuclease RecJ
MRYGTLGANKIQKKAIIKAFIRSFLDLNFVLLNNFINKYPKKKGMHNKKIFQNIIVMG